MESPKILIGVGGGIAAYKVCEVVSTLAKSGAVVRVVLTDGAQQFVTPLTFATLARHAAYTDADFWQPSHGRPLHIELGEWADVMLIAPLTANTLGKLAHGLADNLLTNTVLASTCPVLLAPAMNTDMWEQPSVQRNWRLVQDDPRFHTAGPGAGRLACDRLGAGRMAEPPDLVAQLESLQHTRGQRDLAGKQVLINTGGTREFLDPVRFIGNPSTGKMGLALAQAAQHRGATVTLVHGPMSAELLKRDAGDRRIAVTSAAEMHQVMLHELPTADWILLSAAVADVQPATTYPHKLPKADLPTALPLVPAPDIAADLGQRKQPHQRLIGFAAQTGDILTPALEKLERKQLDAIAANPIDLPDSGFGSDQNQAVFLDKTGRKRAIAPCSKLQMAHRLYDFVQSIE
ncbi:bifunctional phosphopantothenoylcysteine decarboxylase/phosphopantothenate--cysteine ligase CoaBC [Thermoleptolyngbya sp. C42_A2020_037]|uniref:bifunctional phosphopantothenoylcysteine decarboxylase/phosphopantothenate--cysteine ligase CoaBC n=1 Tax=Thermoleptolyngbya sp. C42_A2020_037 TaxID=2747799 RepID=UPI001A060B03|nr:bifunctional phosphopantothenoylcysteine decarboxylase/phosphopantothenate--cysteine ligase CoaBC [Thermoleptolyngbya sp. C42_A2020_037]MBF2084119.1 bifunctional phosphopantothenoylcysteine decarboxylase/phosphopantothenate--cysteine ligase CoaBC [Thermoleptolyngbya sp. C42_A2020_037]